MKQKKMLNLSKDFFYKGHERIAKFVFSIGLIANVNNYLYYETSISFLGKDFIKNVIRIVKPLKVLTIENDLSTLISLYEGNQSNIKKGKIAVCISGEPRTFKACHQSLAAFLSGYDVDYYIHCWSDQYAEELIKYYPGAHINTEDRPDFHTLELDGLTKLGVKDFGDGIKVPYANPNLYPMWYSVKRAFELIAASGKQASEYKFIVRTRFDNFFPKRLGIDPTRPNAIYVDPNYGGYGGFGDQFAIGTPQAMAKYSQLFDWLEQSFTYDFKGLKFHPETLVKVYLEDACGINVIPTAFDMRLLRDDFINLPAHKIPLRSHSTSKARNKYLSDYMQKKFPEYFN